MDLWKFLRAILCFIWDGFSDCGSIQNRGVPPCSQAGPRQSAKP